MSRADAAVAPMTERETARAVARDDRLIGLQAYQCLGRMFDMAKAIRTCGMLLGYRRTYEARKGVYNPGHGAVSSCHKSGCPKCGLEIGLRRWAVLILAMARHVQAGGYLAFVSVAPQHDLRESVETKLARLRFVTDWLPGSGEASPGRRFMAANGITSFVRVIEPTLGGLHGVNFGAHYLLFCEPDPGERPQDSAALMGVRLQQAMGDWVMELALAGKSGAEAKSDVWGYYLSDRAFDSRVAGVSDARYVTKLLDGPGLAGASSELAEPTGAKSGVRNISLRAFPLVLARETQRLGYRQPSSAIKSNARLVVLAQQYGDIMRVLRRPRVRLFSPSKLLFKQWEHLSTPDLVAAAKAVLGDADPEASEAVGALLGVLDQPLKPVDPDDDPAPPGGDGPDDVGYDVASQAFHQGGAEEGSIDHHDDDHFRTVVVDDDVAGAFRLRESEAGVGWQVDVVVCRMLDRLGSWAGVVAFRDAVRGLTGEATFLHKRGDPRQLGGEGYLVGDAPKLLVTTERDEQPGWDPVSWEFAEGKGRRSVKRRPMTKVERNRAQRRAPAA